MVEWAMLVVMVAQAGILVWALLLTRRHFSATRAAALLERFSSNDFLQVRKDVDVFLQSLHALPPPERVAVCRQLCARTEQTITRFNHLHAVGMFFVEVGVCIDSKLIIKRDLHAFDRLLPEYWHKLTPFIIACHREFGFESHCRSDSQIDITEPLSMFNYFRIAYKHLKDADMALEPKPPHRGESNDDGEWGKVPSPPIPQPTSPAALPGS